MTTIAPPNRHHPLAKCEECPFYEEQTYVPSAGPDRAKLVLVGEVPSIAEVKKGIPFTGAAGQLLDSLLAHAGAKQSEVFLTNVCLCRPKTKTNNIPVQAIRACAERLEAEIQERQPETIVTMGNTAAHVILRTTEGVTKLRSGPPKVSDRFPGVEIIPTFNPAATLYNANAFPDLVTDFSKLRKEPIGERKNWNPPNWKLFDDEMAAQAIEAILREGFGTVAIDIEVGVDKDVDFDHPDRYRMLCIGISYAPGKAIVIGERACELRVVRNKLRELITDERITKVYQNGKFDVQGLMAFLGLDEVPAVGFDTMLAHYCLDERRGTHSLDQLGIEYLGTPDWKHEISAYVPKGGSYALIPRDILYRYNAYDVAVTRELVDVFTPLLVQDNLERTHRFLARSSRALTYMERAGVAVDMAYLEELEEEYKILLGHLKEELKPYVANPNSWQQIQHVLKTRWKISVKDTTKDTLAKLRDQAFRKGNEELVTFLTTLLEYKKEAKMESTYVRGIRKRVYRERVHPTFLLHGTVTGRLSSRNPNLQNIPRGSRARKLFVASDDDHVLIQADYRQAEYRVLCWLARDAYLREVFSDDGRDIHGEVAARFYGPSWTKEQRVRAKAIVFGLAYGREAFSIALEYGMSVQEAEAFMASWFDLIPDTVNWIESVENRILAGQDLETPFGRKRRFWLITDGNRSSVLKEGRAFIPQATASDLTLESANRLVDQGFGNHLRIPVHDALVLEVPQGEAEEMAEVIRRTMSGVAEELFEGYIPAPVDIGIGRSWGELG